MVLPIRVFCLYIFYFKELICVAIKFKFSYVGEVLSCNPLPPIPMCYCFVNRTERRTKRRRVSIDLSNSMLGLHGLQWLELANAGVNYIFQLTNFVDHSSWVRVPRLWNLDVL